MRGIQLLRRLYNFGLKFIELIKTVIGKTVADAFGVLSYLNDLLALEPSFSNLKLELVLKGLEIVKTCLIVKSLINRLNLFLYSLHPLI